MKVPTINELKAETLILELCERIEDYTQSDLQGRVTVIVRDIFDLARKDKKD